MKYLLALVIVLLASAQADACSRCGRFGVHCRFRQHHAVHHAPQVIHQTILYQAGAQLQVEAIIQRALQQARLYPQPQQPQVQQPNPYAQPQPYGQPQPVPYPYPQQQINPYGQQGSPQQLPPGGVPNEPQPYVSVLQTKCASCHSGATPKAGILLDGTAPLSYELKVRASLAVIEGRMPPKERPPLNEQEYGYVLREIITLKNEGE